MKKSCHFWRYSSRNENGKKIQILRTIDGDTGEVIGEKKKYLDKMFSDRGYQFRFNSKYVKLFHSMSLPSTLTLKETGMFFKMILHIEGSNQVLAYWNGHGMQPLTIEKMCDEFGCTKRQVVIFLNKLKRNGIIKTVSKKGEEWYAVNPMYAMKGKLISQETFSCFYDELKGEVPKSVQDSWI